MHGVTAPQTEHLVLANLTAREATASLTYFFEDAPPLHRIRKGRAHGSTIYRFGKDDDFPGR